MAEREPEPTVEDAQILEFDLEGSEAITGRGEGEHPDDELPDIGEDVEDEAAIPASAR